MEEHLSIPRLEELPIGQDFEKLRLAGIELAQRYSGAIWTDYNEHDPGVTLLEHLCYTLTDLTFRTNFTIEDLLFAREGERKPVHENAFFPPFQIYRVNPLVATDYRRLIVDRVDGVSNAWIEPIKDNRFGYRGLLRIRLQLMDGISQDNTKEKIIKDVRAAFLSHRCLCEDLEEIIILETEKLNLEMDISIEADAFGESVIARIFHQVDHFLNPGIRFYAKEELLAEGWGPEKIFSGPLPLHGFIKEDELRELPASTRISDLREVISKVEGVKTIDDLKVRKNGQLVVGDEIQPGPQAALGLDNDLREILGKNGDVKVSRDGAQLRIDTRQTLQYLNNLEAKAKKGFQLLVNLEPPPTTSNKQQGEIKAYHSFQRLLPGVYGLGGEGVPGNYDRTHRSKIRQLRGYLLIFEQFMANYLAQLSKLPELFSIAKSDHSAMMIDEHDEDHPSTYFTQFPYDVPSGLSYFIQEENGKRKVPTTKELSGNLAKIREDVEKALKSLNRVFDPADDRKNRFLDHLLARFGELYNGEYLKNLSSDTRNYFHHYLIQGKSSFLRNYVELSGDRDKAFDYSQPAWNTENVSGLKKRIAMSLNQERWLTTEEQEGVPKHANRLLARGMPIRDLNWNDYEEGDEAPASGIRLPFKRLIKWGIEPGSYRIEGRGRKHKLIFLRGKKEEEVALFRGTKQKCEQARDKLIAKCWEINEYGEGFFLLENILLRPLKKPNSLLVFTIPAEGDFGGREFRSPAFTQMDDLEDLSLELLILASKKGNYRILTVEGAHYIVISKKNRPILISEPIPHKEIEVAESELNYIRTKIEDIRNNEPYQINNLIHYKLEQFPGHQVPADFYSLRVSLIMPSWPAILQGLDFRQFFQRMVAANLPSHLAADFYWLDIPEMERFESLFRSWLEAYQKNKPDETQQLSFQLVEQLLARQRAKNKEEENVAAKSYRFPKPLLENILSTFGYELIFDRNDLRLFVGIDEKMEKWLRKNKFTSWRQLSTINEAAIENARTALGILEEEPSANKIKRQVRLAQRGHWRELIRWQRREKAGLISSRKAKIAKIESRWRQLLESPEKLITRLQNWWDRLEDGSIPPLILIDFLLSNGGFAAYGKNDLSVFSYVDKELKNELASLGYTSWSDLADKEVDADQLVKSLAEQSPKYGSLKVTNLLEEAKLAQDNKWGELTAMQQGRLTGEKTQTPIERFTEELLVKLNKEKTGPVHELYDLLVKLKQSPEFKPVKPSPTDEVWRKAKEVLVALGYDGLFGKNDLQLIEGIGPAIEKALTKGGLSTWEALRDAKDSDISKALDKEGISPHLQDLDFWREQVGLALDGQWEEWASRQRDFSARQEVGEKHLSKIETLAGEWMKLYADDLMERP